jgi:hypothetical protein
VCLCNYVCVKLLNKNNNKLFTVIDCMFTIEITILICIVKCPEGNYGCYEHDNELRLP